MPRETATQRRARQSREARESQEDWARTLPMKVLQDMARARKLGVQVTVDSQEHEPWVHVSFMGDQEDCCVVKVGNAEQCTPRGHIVSPACWTKFNPNRNTTAGKLCGNLQ